MIPGKKQWQQWSLPSKYTAVGLITGVGSLLISLGSLVICYSEDQDKIDLSEEVKKAYREIQADNERDEQYVNRYLKGRIAEIEAVKVIDKDGNPVARVYYYSYWEKFTSYFRASIEIRRISELNKKYRAEEGWEKAMLTQHGGDYGHTIYLGGSEFVEIGNISEDVVYEIRMVDFNYDSDEPPTIPFRFQVM